MEQKKVGQENKKVLPVVDIGITFAQKKWLSIIPILHQPSHALEVDKKRTHRLWGAGKAELVTKARVRLVGLPLHQVGDRVARAPAVHHLRRAVVRVHDVGPRDVSEVFAPLQLLHRLANLEKHWVQT